MSDHESPSLSDFDVERIESLLRALTPEDTELVVPPADVWAGIEAELADDAAHEVAHDEPDELAEVVAIDRHRRGFSTGWTIGAAAAAAALIVGTVVAIDSGSGSDTTLVASADLDYDAVNFDELGADADARVSLVEEDGTFRIEIDESDLPAELDEPADLELWLIEPDADGNPRDLVSLGLVDPDDPGSFIVPATYDPDEYFVVDISVEPRDGDATHSGRSILRGPLTEI